MGNLWNRPYGPKTIAASASSQSGLNAQAALAGMSPAVLVLAANGEAVVPHPENGSISFSLQLPGNKGFEQQLFNLVATGIVTTTSVSNITAKVGVGTSLTPGSNTSIGASTATAVNSTTASWKAKAELLYDSTSGKLTGEIEFMINNSTTAKANLAAVVTGIKDANDPVANFVLSFISSGAAAGTLTTVSVKSFTIG